MERDDFDCGEILRYALREDLGDGDHTTFSTIPDSAGGEAQLKVKESGIISGVRVAQEIFNLVEPGITMEVMLRDGDAVEPGDIAFFVRGKVRSLLIAERLVLNMMQRMSGIATQTARVVKLLEGTSARVLDTRKTTPGLRFYEKMAVLHGGGMNHRFGLYDMILIKDNHVDFAGGIEQALTRCREYLESEGRQLDIEIETRNLDEVKQVLAHGPVKRILLDNFEPQKLKEAVAFIGGACETEASGGITLGNCRLYAESGVNYISMGALTHSVKSLDLSLKAKLK